MVTTVEIPLSADLQLESHVVETHSEKVRLHLEYLSLSWISSAADMFYSTVYIASADMVWEMKPQ